MSSLHDDARQKVNRLVREWIEKEILPKLPPNPPELSDAALEREAWIEFFEELEWRWR